MAKYNFSTKTALVTGGTGGIGSSIVKNLLECGATVIATTTNLSKIQDLKLSIDEQYHEKLLALACDLSDHSNVGTLCNRAMELADKIDILVNNAGLTNDKLIMKMKDDDFTNVLNVNLVSSFILCRDFAVHMAKNRSGRIINIASVVAMMGNAGQANYVASKAGLIGFTKTLSIEFAKRGITANCIAPGFIETKMTSSLNDSVKESILGNIPAGRYGSPEDIANGVLFLASEDSAYITGTVLHINGGMVRV